MRLPTEHPRFRPYDTPPPPHPPPRKPPIAHRLALRGPACVADAPPEAWHARLGVDPSPDRGHTSFVLLSDAAYGEVVDLLSGLDYAFPTGKAAWARVQGCNNMNVLLSNAAYRKVVDLLARA